VIKGDRKYCDHCGREVRETIHTQVLYVVDYYTKVEPGKSTIICHDCLNKPIHEPRGETQ
jgi:hypothetical protein